MAEQDIRDELRAAAVRAETLAQYATAALHRRAADSIDRLSAKVASDAMLLRDIDAYLAEARTIGRLTIIPPEHRHAWAPSGQYITGGATAQWVLACACGKTAVQDLGMYP